MADKLLIKKFEFEGWDGDRAGRNTPYDDYKLVLERNGEETELVYINGHDSFYCSHRDKDTVLKELGEAVKKFEKIFNVKATGMKLVKNVITTEKWVEE